LGYRDY